MSALMHGTLNAVIDCWDKALVQWLVHFKIQWGIWEFRLLRKAIVEQGCGFYASFLLHRVWWIAFQLMEVLLHILWLFFQFLLSLFIFLYSFLHHFASFLVFSTKSSKDINQKMKSWENNKENEIPGKKNSSLGAKTWINDLLINIWLLH